MLLLRRKRDVCVPSDVDLITGLDFIQQRRIRDTPAVSPVVRTNDADRSRVLVDIGDGHGHCSQHGRRASGCHILPHGGGPGHVVDRRLARRVHCPRDGVVVRRRYFIPDLELIELLYIHGHVDSFDLAIGFPDVDHAPELSIDFMVPETVTVCVGSVLVCAQPGTERTTAISAAPRPA